MRYFRNRSILILMCVLISFPSFAADKKDKAAKRAAMMMQKLKQDLEAEKVSMQTQFDTEKKALQESIRKAEQTASSNQARLGGQLRKTKQLEADFVKVSLEKTALEDQYKQTQEKLDALTKQLEETKQNLSSMSNDLKFNDGQRKTLSTNLAKTNQQLSQCESKNMKLHQFGSELIHIYDSPSIYQKIMREEPFFQLKRVELENILQEKQDQVNDQLVIRPQSASLIQ